MSDGGIILMTLFGLLIAIVIVCCLSEGVEVVMRWMPKIGIAATIVISLCTLFMFGAIVILVKGFIFFLELL